MRIGLLRCDEIFEVLRPRYEGYQKLFNDLFSAVRPGVEIVDYPVMEGTFPSAPDEQDGWLITGSARGAYEDEPWIHDLLDLVRDLDSARAPTVGVCFGHQVIAEALGGRVERVRTLGIGNRAVHVDQREGWMTPGHDTVGIFHCHHDQVLDLPRSARRIASSAHCPVAALAVGDHLLGIQAHPEFDATYAEVLYRGRYSSSGVPGVLDDALATLDAPLHRVEVAEWVLRFLRGDTVQSASLVD
jgi:GMP synthase-like glutamine amidotransferase